MASLGDSRMPREPIEEPMGRLVLVRWCGKASRLTARPTPSGVLDSMMEPRVPYALSVEVILVEGITADRMISWNASSYLDAKKDLTPSTGRTAAEGTTSGMIALGSREFLSVDRHCWLLSNSASVPSGVIPIAPPTCPRVLGADGSRQPMRAGSPDRAGPDLV